jgi:hypothetical protein
MPDRPSCPGLIADLYDRDKRSFGGSAGRVALSSATVTTVTAPEGRNDPPGNAQSGDVCGLITGQLGLAVEVTLRRATPLAEPLQLEPLQLVPDDAGVVLRTRDGDPLARSCSTWLTVKPVASSR